MKTTTQNLLACSAAGLFFAGSASAVDVTTIDTGEWDSDAGNTGNLAIWDSGFPGAGDTAIINHPVTVDRNDNAYYSGYIGYDTTPADVVVNAGGQVMAWFGIFNAPTVTLNGGQIGANQRTHVLTTNSLTVNDVAGNVWTQYKSQTGKHAKINATQLLGDGTLDIQLGKAGTTAGQLFELNVDDTTGFTGVLNVSRLGHTQASPGGFLDRRSSNTETNVAHLKINQSIAKADASFSMVLNEYTYDWTEANGGTAALDDGTAYNGYDIRDDSVEVWLTGLNIGGFEVPARETAYTAAELIALDANIANYLRSDGTDGLLGVVGGGAIPGDFDGDGDVDGVDVATMFSNFNGPGGGVPTNPLTDLDGDGDADGVDVANLFGLFTGPLAPASVPEPTSLALLGLGGLLTARRRRA